MRAGCGFGMILHRESRSVTQTDTFDGSVIQIHMRNLHIGRSPYRIGIHTKTMVLCGDFTPPRKQIPDRMVQPPVPVMHFESRYAHTERQQLMAEADTKQGLAGFKKLFDDLYGKIHGRGITRTIAQKISGRVECLKFRDRGSCRKHPHIRMAISETPEDIPLDAIIKYGDTEGSMRITKIVWCCGTYG